MAHKKTITVFSGYYVPHLGGVERYVDKLSHALVKRGYNVIIVTSNHDHLKSTETVGNIKVYRLPVYRLFKERYPLLHKNSEYKELIRKINKEEMDYVICNTRFHLTSLLGARIGKHKQLPVLLIEHGTDHFTVGSRWLDYMGAIYEHCLTYYLKRFVDRYYGVSKRCNEWLKHFRILASGVFYNAIDINDSIGVGNSYSEVFLKNEVVITYAGRLIKEKGVLNLLEAFLQLKQRRPHLKIKLAIAGSGDLLQYIKDTYPDSAIHVLGKLDFTEVMALYKRTDIFVYPSLYPEGLPTSILEAGLMGCALVATPRGGTEEVIIDKRHGIIVDGSIRSLRDALERLSTNSALRSSLADTVKQRVERVFNWPVVAREVVSEINKIKVE